MYNNTKLLHHESNADSILESLGLTRAILRRAVETGVRAYRRASVFHPRTHGGSTAWGETVGTIRQELKAQGGWHLSDDAGLPRVINKGKGVTLVVTSGDKETGIDAANPSSRNNKGSATKDFVLKNHDLFEPHLLDKKEPEHGTWVLMYHYDLAKKEVRYELSLPLELSANGHFNRWYQRFVLPPISLDDTLLGSEVKKPDFNDDIDLNILKKAK